MVVLHLTVHITVKREDVSGYMKSTGDRLGKQEKAKWGNLGTG